MMAPETVVTVTPGKPATPQEPQQQGGQQQQQGRPLGWIAINIEYFKTGAGILKIVQLVLGILCMALSSTWYSAWFVFVAVICFIATLLWTFVYFLSIREALKLPVNWVMVELIFVGIETFLYLTAFITLFAVASSHNEYLFKSNIAAAVFGMFNTFAYGASSYLLYKEYKG